MKVLVDTSVWVDHLRGKNEKLVTLLNSGDVVIHDDIIGELSCGNLQNRAQKLLQFESLSKVTAASKTKVLTAIEKGHWYGKGIGWTDANLLQSTIQEYDCRLWTLDKRLANLANAVGVAFNG